jgi:hypothetical protein
MKKKSKQSVKKKPAIKAKQVVKKKAPIKVKAKSVKKEVKEEKIALLNFKASEADKKQIKAKAIKYTKGNVSKWIRLASREFTPKDQDSFI